MRHLLQKGELETCRSSRVAAQLHNDIQGFRTTHTQIGIDAVVKNLRAMGADVDASPSSRRARD